MKKVFSLVAVALLTVSVLFTACRDNASQAPAQTEETAPATEEQTAPAQEAPQEAAAPDTTTQQAQ
jgi:hypothetical protein